jgi:hypothetical protein
VHGIRARDVVLNGGTRRAGDDGARRWRQARGPRIMVRGASLAGGGTTSTRGAARRHHDRLWLYKLGVVFRAAGPRWGIRRGIETKCSDQPPGGAGPMTMEFDDGEEADE